TGARSFRQQLELVAMTGVMVQASIEAAHFQGEHVHFAGMARSAGRRRLEHDVALPCHGRAMLNAPRQLKRSREVAHMDAQRRKAAPRAALQEDARKFT